MRHIDSMYCKRTLCVLSIMSIRKSSGNIFDRVKYIESRSFSDGLPRSVTRILFHNRGLEMATLRNCRVTCDTIISRGRLRSKEEGKEHPASKIMARISLGNVDNGDN